MIVLEGSIGLNVYALVSPGVLCNSVPALQICLSATKKDGNASLNRMWDGSHSNTAHSEAHFTE